MSTEYQRIEVGDEIYEFPMEMSDEEIASAVNAEYAMKMKQGQTPLADTLQASLVDRGERVQNMWTRNESGIDPRARTMATAGHVVGAGFDAAGHVISTLVPEGIQEWTEKQVKDFLMYTPPGRKIGELMAAGGGAWSEFEREHPDAATVFSGIASMGLIAGNPLRPSDAQDALEAYAKKSGREALKDRLEWEVEQRHKMVRPDDLIGEGEIGEEGFFRVATYAPTETEDTIANSLHLVPEIEPQRSYWYNTQKVEEAITKSQDEVNKKLGKFHRNKFNREELTQEIDLALEDMSRIPGFEVLSGASSETAQNYLITAARLIDESKGTSPRDLLRIRREFDAKVTEGGVDFGSETTNGKLLAARYVRNVLNEKLHELTDNQVYHEIAQQSNLLSAKEIFRAKAATQQRNALSRTYHAVSDTVNLPKTPLFLALTAGAAGGALTAATGGVGPAVAATALSAGGGVAVWKAFQALEPRNRKATLAKMARALKNDNPDKAIILELAQTGQLWAEETQEDE